MTKQDIYNEMMKQFESGKREWSFEEVANIYERNQKTKKSVIKILSKMKKEQNGK